MKKIIAFLTLIMVCLSFTACGGFLDGDSEYTLENLREEYRSDMLAHARSLTDAKSGEFEVVILEKEQTVEKLQAYTFSRNLDVDEITRGLFVKFSLIDSEGLLHTSYYNYGLEFNKKQKKDIRFSLDGNEETWRLEVVKENNHLLFEYSIVEPLR